MKVVINACFGGFGLSPEGEAAYLAKRGKEAFFYAEDRSSGKPIGEREYVRVEGDAAKRAFMLTTLTENIGEKVSKDAVWPSGSRHPSYFNERDLERNDPDLVAVVEELGDKASGGYAHLIVVEVPDDVQWHIEEYDGNEHVAENHRTWYGTSE